MVAASIAHYRVIRQIGRGGMGEVYLAHDNRLKRPVALKILPAAVVEDGASLHRFRKEAEAASALNHPNIITIHEIGEADGLHFIATEYIDGESLRSRMMRGPFELHELLDLVIQVSSALAAAHAAGIVHRDVKPENIMVRRDGYAKMVDFGLAKLFARPSAGGASDADTATRSLFETERDVILGTPKYMSPEQVRGIFLDPRTDIWSLGVVIYEMVARQLPFTGGTVADLVASIVKVEPPPLPRGVPAELSRIVFKALEKDRGHRYQTVADLHADLTRLKRDLELGAATSRTGRLTTVSRRALQSTGIAALLIAVAIAAWFARRDFAAVEPSSSAAPATSALTVDFQATPMTIQPNEPVVLTWTVTGASGVTIEGVGAVSDTGQRTLFPTRTTVYWLTASNAVTSRTASVQVIVEDARSTAPVRDSQELLNAQRDTGPGPVTGGAEAVQRRAFTPPATVDGRVVWNGNLAPGEALTIAGARASAGTLANALPDGATILDVVPSTIKQVRHVGDELVLENAGAATQTTIIVRWRVTK